MPIKKAAFKDLRKSKNKAKKNKAVKESIAYLLKKAKKAVEAKDKSKAEEMVKKVIKAVDKAIQKGVIKKNTGARKKSSIMKKLNSLAKS